MREELEDLCTQLKLDEQVYLPGVVKNVDAYLRKADIFAMTSRFEGFPRRTRRSDGLWCTCDCY